MCVEIADNKSRKALPIIMKAREDLRHSRFAVTFVSRGGLVLIKSAIGKCLRRGGEVEFLVGLDPATSEPEAL